MGGTKSCTDVAMATSVRAAASSHGNRLTSELTGALGILDPPTCRSNRAFRRAMHDDQQAVDIRDRHLESLCHATAGCVQQLLARRCDPARHGCPVRIVAGTDVL